jgi:phosphatidylglycerophosphatase A
MIVPTKADRLFIFLGTGLGLSVVPSRLTARFSKASTHARLHERKVTGAGLIGSLEGALTYLLLPAVLAQSLWFLLIGVAASVWVAGRAERALETHDDARIVVDEWIGCWIACWGLEQQLGWMIVFAFVLFRLFDVLKGPIGGRLQNLPGGWGVIADDVYAGIAANLTWRFTVELVRFAH